MQVTLKPIPNEERAQAILDKTFFSKAQKETLQGFLLQAGQAYFNQKFELVCRGKQRYIQRERLEIQISASDGELLELARLGYLQVYADPPGIVFLTKVMGDPDD